MKEITTSEDNNFIVIRGKSVGDMFIKALDDSNSVDEALKKLLQNVKTQNEKHP